MEKQTKPETKVVKRLTTFNLCDTLEECTNAILTEPHLLGAEIKLNQEGKFVLQMISNVVAE